VRCFAHGCIADYNAGVELVDQLKQGQVLTLEAVDKANSLIRLTVSLADFVNAYNGHSREPKVFEELLSAKEMQANLERQRRVEEDRKVRCEAR
jgi:hypothetical protein